MNFFKKLLSPINFITARNDRPVDKETDKNKKIIEEFLKSNGIGYVQMNQVAVGPSITTYSFKPSSNVKIQQMLDLKNELALALYKHPIRVGESITNTQFIDIEVPNIVRTFVNLREELDNEDYKKQKSDLTICLGHNFENKSYYADLAKLPHLLIVGATNSGKSSFIHSLITSLLVSHSPETLRLVLADPKRVEFPSYMNIPHLLTPAIVKVDKTMEALKMCLDEMGKRFEILSKAGNKSIASFNEISKDKMPYIIFIIDELSDLMVAAGKEAEDSIIKLAREAGAVGIHLILATSRPSADIVTSALKNNISARLAFATASAENSFTILDSSGAEKLLGRGDALFKDSEFIKPIRLQVPYISDEDIEKIVDSLRK